MCQVPLISPPRDWHVLEVIIRTLERRLHGFALLLLLKLTISQALRAVVPELPLAVHDQRRRHNPRHLHSEFFFCDARISNESNRMKTEICRFKFRQ